ncbi:hypothetical protein ACFSE1_06185 [Rhizobium helianthi]|uniref:PIN domain-containing protein n=1 Tax=Rhizobium helianthi TaxID=1132695 RepID=A0ABW4M3R3_9HYPH
MKYLVSSCALSETSKPRPSFDISRVIAEHDCVLAPETLIDIQRGIHRLSIYNPKRAAELRAWYSNIVGSWRLVEGLALEKAKVFASMLECRPLKTLWLPNPKAANPSFGYHIAIAATAIVHELPLAVVSSQKFVLIDRYFRLPGIYDVGKDVWISSLSQDDLRAA